jgi:hypothetical protein
MRNQKTSSMAVKQQIGRKKYEKELRRLQIQLCKLQDWVKFKGLRIILVLEGREPAHISDSRPTRPIGPREDSDVHATLSAAFPRRR